MQMSRKTLEECAKQLQKSDRDTLERRAQRLKELEQIHTDARLFHSQKEWDYAGEASDSYINGNYRSVIFCCAFAIDQIFRYEYLKTPRSRYEDLEKRTFGQTIRKCKGKNISRLAQFIAAAELLNRMRNEVSAHPLFVDFPVEADPERQVRNMLLREDIKKLLSLVESVNPKVKNEIEGTKLIDQVGGEACALGDAVNQRSKMPSSLDGFWGLIERDILKLLAREAWHILKIVAEGLYGVKP
jgi:hypothetical protein